MNSPLYRISLMLTILLTVAAAILTLGWLGSLVNGVGKLPALSLIPWVPLGLFALTAINCTIRNRMIVGRGRSA